jgi:predicted Zn-dependent protease with MMP-like domain
MTVKEFEDLVAAALDGLPEAFARAMDNVEVVVEIWPTREDLIAGGTPPSSTLFGLYRGIPKTKRANYQGALPDKIVIFAGPIVQMSGENPDAVKKQVRNTVLHEIGHHFGMSDEDIRAAGK